MLEPTARPLEPLSSSDRDADTSAPPVAVLLNAHARQVNDRVVSALSQVVPAEDLFVAHSREEGREIAAAVVERAYPMVFCGGGDGTFIAFLNDILHQLEQRGLPADRAPKFGLLKLGTGNGLAATVHASPVDGGRFLEDLVRALSGEVPTYRALDLLEVDGQRTVFAGTGADGQVINDFLWVKQNLARGALHQLMTGRSGFLASVALRTLPYYFTHSSYTDCEVLNGGRAAYRLGPDGRTTAEIEPGQALFRGRVNFAAASTIPFYGYQLRMFPFAGARPSMMHLRLSAVPVLAVLAHLPQVWTGEWFHPEIHDFHAAEVTLRFSRPMPFQVGGDAEGYRDSLHLKVAPERIELADFHA